MVGVASPPSGRSQALPLQAQGCAAGMNYNCSTRQSGIWLAEEVVSPEPFFGRLAARGLVPTIEVMLDDSHIGQRGHQRH
jgi:hypothetical protein